MSFLLTVICALLLASPALTDNLFTYSVTLPDVVKQALGYHPNTYLTFEELTEQYGYETEEHFVTTADGYILKLYHMIRPKCSSFFKRSVLLTHGHMEMSFIFTESGREYGLAYTLADACFDVWLGNARGCAEGRNHTTLDPDVDAAFWHFSIDEMISYDVPAFIDFILKETGTDAINYIRYSQGGGSFLGMAADKPEYNDKVKLFIGLAPLTRMLNTRSFTFRLLHVGANSMRNFLSLIGIQEVMFIGSILQTVMEFLCQTDNTNSFRYYVCSNFVHLLDSYRVDSITPDTYKVVYTHSPAGNSVQQLAHYGQSMSTENFQKFDYGTEELNLQHYSSPTPPIYNLSLVTTPSVIFYGKNDFINDPEDLEWATEQLQNLVNLIAVNNTKFNHVDLLKNIEAKSLVYWPAIEYLKKYDN